MLRGVTVFIQFGWFMSRGLSVIKQINWEGRKVSTGTAAITMIDVLATALTSLILSSARCVASVGAGSRRS